MYTTGIKEERFKNLPALPGVYMFKNAKGKVIYIGKAKSLKNRIRSYFQESAELDQRKESMLKKITDFEYIVTASELEALILESNIIKKERPRFNVILRDDKNYPGLMLDMRETWPRLEVVRRMKRNGAYYFGPYVPAGAMWETLSFIRKTFPLCTCKRDLSKPCRPCIQYEIGRCLAPCSGLVARDSYRDIANEVKLFLQGKNKDLIKDLKEKMERASKEMAFEEAAALRDRIKSIKMVIQKQRIILPELPDTDVIGIAREGGIADIQILFLRGGMLIGKKDFLLRNRIAANSEVLYSFLEQFYNNEILPPAEIIVPIYPEPWPRNRDIPESASWDSGCAKDILEHWLSEKRKKAVHILIPKKGKKADLLNMAEENALSFLKGYQLSAKGKKEVLQEIKDMLGLKRIPERIEAFDISNINGTDAVGSMVVYENNAPEKTDYRHYRIKTVEDADDCAMMAEIIYRRYKNILEEKGKMPDLIMMDGGKGQLNSAIKALSNLDIIDNFDIIGLAKEKGDTLDRVYLRGMAEPIILPLGSSATHLLQRVRDESHRFAVTYHRKLRKNKTLTSFLDNVPMIGKQRKKALFTHFGTFGKIKDAAINELKAVSGMTEKSAEQLYMALRRGN